MLHIAYGAIVRNPNPVKKQKLAILPDVAPFEESVRHLRPELKERIKRAREARQRSVARS
jgi:hypothetical protein